VRRLLLLATTVALLAPFAFTTPPAQASATCTLHDVSIDWWSINNQQINGSTHFKCGGSQSGNNGDYYIHYYLQFSNNGNAPWTEAGCQNGSRCESVKPSSGLYNGGQDYPTNFWTFNVNGGISCLWWRIHVVVVFPNIGQVGPNYNDTQLIGGC